MGHTNYVQLKTTLLKEFTNSLKELCSLFDSKVQIFQVYKRL